MIMERAKLATLIVCQWRARHGHGVARISLAQMEVFQRRLGRRRLKLVSR